jgi:ribose transport system substrate-binding protein
MSPDGPITDLDALVAGPDWSGRALDRRTFLRSAGILGGAFGLAGIAAACGSSSSSNSTATTAATTAGTTAGTSAATTATTAGDSTSSGASSIGAGKTIAVSLNVANAYAAYVAQGVLEATKGTEYKFRTVINNADASTELTNIENLISSGIAGLVILPVNADTAAKGAQLCAAKGIAYGNALWPGKSSADKYFTGVAFVDSTKGGQLIGEYLKAHAKPGPTIVVQGILGQGFSEFIDKGLNSAIAGSGFDVVVRQQGFYSRTMATNIVQTGLAAHPSTTAIVTYAASMSDGVAQFLKSRKLTHITHVASDCDEELTMWLKTPYCNATRYYSAAQSGLLAAKAVRAKLEGGTPIFLNLLTEEMVTGATIDQVTAADPFDYPAFASQTASL